MDNQDKDSETGLRFVNPPGLNSPAPYGFSHLALFPRGWRIILPSGHGGGWLEDQELSDDFATQFRQALAITETVLKAANAKMSDVAKITLLVVGHNEERHRVIIEEVERVWGDNKPASTLIPVPRLALEKMLIEIDVIAVVPE